MFDAVDEGAAMFEVAAGAVEAPHRRGDGHAGRRRRPVPNDWYLRLAREAQPKLRRR